MDSKDTARVAKKAGGKALRGVARERAGRVMDQVDDSSEQFRTAASEKIEGLGRQIRELGQQLDHPEAGQRLARRVERSADYLRFRPSAEMAEDAWGALRSSPLVWLGAGVLVGFLAYRVARRR